MTFQAVKTVSASEVKVSFIKDLLAVVQKIQNVTPELVVQVSYTVHTKLLACTQLYEEFDWLTMWFLPIRVELIVTSNLIGQNQPVTNQMSFYNWALIIKMIKIKNGTFFKNEIFFCKIKPNIILIQR